MNYKLAKKLKDAGFPQDYSKGVLNDNFVWDRETPYYTPTLSELIKSCGKDFCRLETGNNINGTSWFATTNEPGEIETGNTPEEAVANLWLYINEK